MAEADGFLGRWARRKDQARRGLALEEPSPLPRDVSATVGSGVHGGADALSNADPQAVAPTGAEAPQTAPEPLTLVDAGKLTSASDFKPFMAQEVAPEVRNAAMKKLFSDPHFNVMDGLDTYIDDYSKPDPIPESMLRQMVSAKFLKLFDEEPAQEAVAGPEQQPAQVQPVPVRENADTAADLTMAQCVAVPEPNPQEDAHSHLRLQPDNASAGPSPGGSTA